MSERTTSASWAMGIVKALEMDGLDCRALFKQIGLDYAALDDPDARFPQDSMTRLWQRAVEQSGNPAILKPFVSPENLWMVEKHVIFQGYYFFHHLG
ncbi:AraC family transcriptional regulator ligand-binding domain-containing protein, partial [Pseudomonas chlororaphis]|uniref:AraC family transcriptional regulator ligand-binding domain-containing protein n=1 Tax=Pseudomonas chlororaphis TaxID=587753 RepID=UPI001FF07E0D